MNWMFPHKVINLVFICMRVCVCDRGGGNRGDIIETINTFLNNFLSLFKTTSSITFSLFIRFYACLSLVFTM